MENLLVILCKDVSFQDNNNEDKVIIIPKETALTIDILLSGEIIGTIGSYCFELTKDDFAVIQ